MSRWYGRWKSSRSLAKRMVEDAVESSLTFGDEPVEFDYELPTDVVELWTLIASIDRIRAAAIEARRILRERMADELGEGGVVRVGEDFVRYGQTVDRSPLDSMLPFLKTLTTNEVLAILPTANFRVTALRTIAEEHGLDAETLDGSLYIDEKKPATVTSMPMSNPRLPKYAAKLDDGEIRRGRKR